MKAAAVLARLFLCLALVAGGGAFAFAQSEEDKAKIAKLKQRAEQGDAEAQTDLARIYFGSSDINVDVDLSEASKWLHLAGYHGSREAQYALASHYRKGSKIVEVNHYKEYIWAALAGKGNRVRRLQAKLKPEKIKEELKKFPSDPRKKAEAAINYFIGYGHEKGDVFLPNYKEAARLYELAAEQGHVQAQHTLGLMYLSGKGVAQDYGEAYIWLALAAFNADVNLEEEAAKNRQTAEEKLTSDELNQAQAEAAKRLEEIKKKQAAAQ